MQNGVTDHNQSSSTTCLEDVEFSIERLPPPPPSPVGLSEEERPDPGNGAAQSLLESPALPKKGPLLSQLPLAFCRESPGASSELCRSSSSLL